MISGFHRVAGSSWPDHRWHARWVTCSLGERFALPANCQERSLPDGRLALRETCWDGYRSPGWLACVTLEDPGGLYRSAVEHRLVEQEVGCSNE